MSRKISESAIRRLSFYHRILEELAARGVATVSSEDLAEHSRTTAAQVRKDLSHFGSFGKRGLGYSVAELSSRIRRILGLDRTWRVALVGAGRIGSALFEYDGFRARGFRFVAVVDAAPERIGQAWGDLTVEPPERLETVLAEQKVNMVVLAVPADVSEEVAERVQRAGIRAILNFAPAALDASPGVTVRDVNMVMELEALSFAMTQQEEEDA